MEITEIKIFPVQEDKLKAFVSIIFDSCFMVNDIKIIQGKEGLFISMPSRRKKNGRFKDVAHPLNNETRQVMEHRILGRYQEVVSGDEPGGAETVIAPAVATAPPPQAVVPALKPPAPEAPSTPAPAAQDAPRPAEAEATPQPSEEKTLEEVAEAHLSDSYWTT